MVTFRKTVAGVSATSLQRFVLRARKAARLKGAADVLVTSSSEMRSLNARFRNKNKPTDVLSFPAVVDTATAGEIAISAAIAIDNAHRLGHTPDKEVKVLILHGILHLAGYDHERDNGQMARKEASLRRLLNLPESLTERHDHYQQKASRARAGKPRTRKRSGTV